MAVYPQAKKSIIEISEPAYKKVKNTYELEQHCNTSIVDSHLEGSFNLSIYNWGFDSYPPQ